MKQKITFFIVDIDLISIKATKKWSLKGSF